MDENKNLTVEKIFSLALNNHQKNNIEEAQDLYYQILKINPGHIHALKNLGATFISQREYLKAKDIYEKAIEIDSNSADSYSNLGIVFKNLGELQKAKDCFEKAIEIDPNFANSHNNLGNIHAAIGESQKAKDCFEKAIEIDPNSASAYSNLGSILCELGEYQKAKDCFEKAIEIDPNSASAYSNLGIIFKKFDEYQKAKDCFEKAIEIDSNFIQAYALLATLKVNDIDNPKEAIVASYNSLSINLKRSVFINHRVPLFKLKHDVQQARYLISKDYNINGMDEFQKMGDEILSRKKNKQNINNANKNIFLDQNEINALLPFYKSNYTYQTKEISGSCINPNKNWQDVEDEYFNSSNQIIYIDNFLSEEAIIELQKFCLLSKVWNKQYQDKYLGAFSDQGFISPIHLQIAIELKQKLPKLFGPHRIEKFWGFKYDATLGKGINIHADFAILNLNFWITPDKYNNNKNSGGLKVYDTPAPDNWTFKDYNSGTKDKVYKFLKDNNANCTNVPYKFNRAVLFNSAYFHETDEIDFKDEYEGRRINMTYLFGARPVNNRN